MHSRSRSRSPSRSRLPSRSRSRSRSLSLLGLIERCRYKEYYRFSLYRFIQLLIDDERYNDREIEEMIDTAINKWYNVLNLNLEQMTVFQKQIVFGKKKSIREYAHAYFRQEHTTRELKDLHTLVKFVDAYSECLPKPQNFKVMPLIRTAYCITQTNQLYGKSQTVHLDLWMIIIAYL